MYNHQKSQNNIKINISRGVFLVVDTQLYEMLSGDPLVSQFVVMVESKNGKTFALDASCVVLSMRGVHNNIATLRHLQKLQGPRSNRSLGPRTWLIGPSSYLYSFGFYIKKSGNVDSQKL